MKRYCLGTALAIALATLMLARPVVAQMCTGDIRLETQAEVDAFACTDVTGHLLIIDADGMVQLDSLAGLTSVGRTLLILGNDMLTNVDGLAGLTSVAGDLSIQENDALSTCDCGLFHSCSASDAVILSKSRLT